MSCWGLVVWGQTASACLGTNLIIVKRTTLLPPLPAAPGRLGLDVRSPIDAFMRSLISGGRNDACCEEYGWILRVLRWFGNWL